MQAIVNVALISFLDHFNHARSTVRNIGYACCTQDELVSAISNEQAKFERSTGLAPNPVRRFDRMSRFFKHACKVRASYQDNKCTGGYVVLNGELLALHSTVRGSGDWLMRNAVADGAHRLNCYEVPHLLALYKRHGFKVLSVESNHILGGPNIVYMVRP